MKIQLSVVLAIVFSSCIANANSESPSPNAVFNDRTKTELVTELRRYSEIRSELAKRQIDLDPIFVNAWKQKAMRVELGNRNGEVPTNAQARGDVEDLASFNWMVSRDVENSDRLLVLECCHQIKKDRPCKTLSEAKKRDLEQCKKTKK